MNLLMVAPLLDSRGNVRYFIGAQVDVTGLCKEGSDLDALRRVLDAKSKRHGAEAKEAANDDAAPDPDGSDEFQELSEMFNVTEIDLVRRCGGRMHGDRVDPGDDSHPTMQRPRLLLKDTSNPYKDRIFRDPSLANGKLGGIYQNVSFSLSFSPSPATSFPRVKPQTNTKEASAIRTPSAPPRQSN
jgi:hypothetical protein